jgi:hypothetical protein
MNTESAAAAKLNLSDLLERDAPCARPIEQHQPRIAFGHTLQPRCTASGTDEMYGLSLRPSRWLDEPSWRVVAPIEALMTANTTKHLLARSRQSSSLR